MLFLELVAKGIAFMSRHRTKFAALKTIIAIALALPCTALARANADAEERLEQRAVGRLQMAADYGIDIVRIPPPAAGIQPPAPSPAPRPSPPPPSGPPQPQARPLKLPLKVG